MSASTETDILAGLDFEHTPPCEHSLHGGHGDINAPAEWVADVSCPDCGARRRYLICEPDREWLCSPGWTHCPACEVRRRWYEAMKFTPIPPAS